MIQEPAQLPSPTVNGSSSPPTSSNFTCRRRTLIEEQLLAPGVHLGGQHTTEGDLEFELGQTSSQSHVSLTHLPALRQSTSTVTATVETAQTTNSEELQVGDTSGRERRIPANRRSEAGKRKQPSPSARTNANRRQPAARVPGPTREPRAPANGARSAGMVELQAPGYPLEEHWQVIHDLDLVVLGQRRVRTIKRIPYRHRPKCRGIYQKVLDIANSASQVRQRDVDTKLLLSFPAML